MKQIDFEVLIVGGGPAGLTGALTLGRGNRTVLICDGDSPRNGPAEFMHNFPSQEGTPPLEFRRKIQKELLSYPHVQYRKTQVLSVEPQGSEFSAHLTDGSNIKVRKVLIASGIRDKLPEIPGLPELWGKSVFHCPYCHGYEFKNQKIGLIGDRDYLMHMGPLASGLSQQITFFSNGPAVFSESDLAILDKQGVTLFQEKIQELDYQGFDMRAVILENEQRVACEALLVKTQLQQSSKIAESLGCAKNDMGFYTVDVLKRSNVPGVSIAGDLTEMIQSVLVACQTGQVAGAGLNFDLLHEKWFKT